MSEINGLDMLRQELENAPVISKGNYNYYLWSVTEQHPPLLPKVLKDCSKLLLEKMNYGDADIILTAEAMGISIATTMSLLIDRPIIIGTKRKKGVPNEYESWYQCGYKMDVLNFSEIRKGSSVLVVDDVISTGGTCLAMISAVRHFDAKVSDIGVLVNKINYPGLKRLADHGYNPKRLFDIKVEKNKVIVENSF
ncbi:MAG: adenine phosphoribosyltransferase [Nanoarchaeota archaeon]